MTPRQQVVTQLLAVLLADSRWTHDTALQLAQRLADRVLSEPELPGPEVTDRLQAPKRGE